MYCLNMYTCIPGSSKYVKFPPFGRFFMVKYHKFYTLGRSIYIYIFYIYHIFMLVPPKTHTFSEFTSACQWVTCHTWQPRRFDACHRDLGICTTASQPGVLHASLLLRVCFQRGIGPDHHLHGGLSHQRGLAHEDLWWCPGVVNCWTQHRPTGQCFFCSRCTSSTGKLWLYNTLRFNFQHVLVGSIWEDQKHWLLCFGMGWIHNLSLYVSMVRFHGRREASP